MDTINAPPSIMQTETSKMTDEMKRKRLELLFGDPNLNIEDIVKPIGEKELKEKIEELQKEKEDLLKEDEERSTIEELIDEIKNSKDEYESVMKEIRMMRQKQVGGIEETCEIMQTMCEDIVTYVKKVEQHIEDLQKEKDTAVESER